MHFLYNGVRAFNFWLHSPTWNEANVLNARCLGLRRVLFWLSKFIYTKLFGSAQSLHSVSVFQTFTPADCFMLRARSLTLDSALPKIWLRFTIFAKLFHSVQFVRLCVIRMVNSARTIYKTSFCEGSHPYLKSNKKQKRRERDSLEIYHSQT